MKQPNLQCFLFEIKCLEKNKQNLSRRIVSIDLGNIVEFTKIKIHGSKIKFISLVVKESWEVIKIFECVEPTFELHEDLFPVMYEISLDGFLEIYNDWSKYHDSCSTH